MFEELSVEEKQAYHAFCSAAFHRLELTVPTILWHYTTGDTLIKMIQTKSIWSTQVACLNDNKEFSYAVEHFRSAIRSVRETVTDGDAKWLCEWIDGWLDYDGQDRSEFFVCCMSAEPDDLSQWRAYGGGEGGFAIGFDAASVERWCRAEQCLIGPVCYDRDKQQWMAAQLAQATIRFFVDGRRRRPSVDRKKWAETFIEEWRNNVVNLAPFFKDPAFAAEREWRIVRALRPTDWGSLTFLQRRTLMSRHLPLHLGNGLVEDGRLPIRSVLVGPCRYKRISLVSAATLLRNHGYLDGAIDLKESGVPFQLT